MKATRASKVEIGNTVLFRILVIANKDSRIDATQVRWNRTQTDALLVCRKLSGVNRKAEMNYSIRSFRSINQSVFFTQKLQNSAFLFLSPMAIQSVCNFCTRKKTTESQGRIRVVEVVVRQKYRVAVAVMVVVVHLQRDDDGYWKHTAGAWQTQTHQKTRLSFASDKV